MKTITISTSSCADDGNPMPHFSGGIGHKGKNAHTLSSKGILITRKGVNAAVLIAWAQIDALCAQHEPLLAMAPPKVK